MQHKAHKPAIHHIKKVFKHTHDPLWQMHLGVVAIIILQSFTNKTFLPFNKAWLVGIEVVLLIVLAISTSEGYGIQSKNRRRLAIILIILIGTINALSLTLLIMALMYGIGIDEGRILLSNGLIIYLTNILMFALLYWELDSGGPDKRIETYQSKRDFLFPQMEYHLQSESNWLPGFVDYLYLSTTNVTNFASADVKPMSHKAKLLMMIQALISVVVVILVLARAVSVIQ